MNMTQWVTETLQSASMGPVAVMPRIRRVQRTVVVKDKQKQTKT